MIMITVTILALVLVYKSFCNTVCMYMVMQIKLVVVVVFHDQMTISFSISSRRLDDDENIFICGE